MRVLFTTLFVLILIAVEASGTSIDPCPCTISMENILKLIENNNNALKQANSELKDLGKSIETLKKKVEEQEAKICSIEQKVEQLEVIVNTIYNATTSQTVIINNINATVVALDQGLECIESEVNEESCLINDIKNIAIATNACVDAQMCRK